MSRARTPYSLSAIVFGRSLMARELVATGSANIDVSQRRAAVIGSVVPLTTRRCLEYAAFGRLMSYSSMTVPCCHVCWGMYTGCAALTVPALVVWSLRYAYISLMQSVCVQLLPSSTFSWRRKCQATIDFQHTSTGSSDRVSTINYRNQCSELT